MKITVGQLVFIFFLLWILVPGNYHAYTHISISGLRDMTSCKHDIWGLVMITAIGVDIVIILVGFLILMDSEFWNNEIRLDKFDKE